MGEFRRWLSKFVCGLFGTYADVKAKSSPSDDIFQRNLFSLPLRYRFCFILHSKFAWFANTNLMMCHLIKSFFITGHYKLVSHTLYCVYYGIHLLLSNRLGTYTILHWLRCVLRRLSTNTFCMYV